MLVLCRRGVEAFEVICIEDATIACLPALATEGNRFEAGIIARNPDNPDISVLAQHICDRVQPARAEPHVVIQDNGNVGMEGTGHRLVPEPVQVLIVPKLWIDDLAFVLGKRVHGSRINRRARVQHQLEGDLMAFHQQVRVAHMRFPEWLQE